MKNSVMRDKHKIDSNLIYSIIIASGILVLLYYVLKMVLYFTPAITMALLIIYMTRPIYMRVEKITKSRSLSILFAMMLIVFIFSVFTIYFASAVILEVSPLLESDSIKQMLVGYGIDLSVLGAQLPDLYNSLDISKISYSDIVSGDYIAPIKAIAGFLVTTLLNISYLIIQSIMSLMIAFYWVKDRDRLRKFMFDIIPKANHRLVLRFTKELDISLNQIYMGVFFTAIFTGLLSYVIFMSFNIPLSTVLAVISGILSTLPLIGSWLVYLPISIIFAIAGETHTAVIFLLISFLVISSLPDWIARPFIMAKDRKTNYLLIFISILGGLAVFGLLGAFIGPIVMSVFTSFVYAYKSVKDQRA